MATEVSSECVHIERKIDATWRTEKIFIAAMFYNNEGIIPYWSDEIVKLIHYLGPVSLSFILPRVIKY